MKGLSTGQIAERVGIGIETVRFYERNGLIEEPPRKESGYRQYPEEAVLRLRFIRKAKELGFSLKEIKELLHLRVEAATTCVGVKSRAKAKLTEIDSKIKALQRMKRILAKLVDACDENRPTNECPILEALEPGRER